LVSTTTKWVDSYQKKVIVISLSNKSYTRETQNTHFIFRNFFFENRAVREVMWKNAVEPDRPQMTIQGIHKTMVRFQK